jgi:hypothetical protein
MHAVQPCMHVRAAERCAQVSRRAAWSAAAAARMRVMRAAHLCLRDVVLADGGGGARSVSVECEQLADVCAEEVLL